MAGPWESYPAQAAVGPWQKYSSQEPALPDIDSIQSGVQHKLTQATEPSDTGIKPPPMDHPQALDVGMGMPVTQMIGKQGNTEKLTPEMRKNLINAYKTGTATDAADFMQSAIPAASQTVDEHQGLGSMVGEAMWLGINKNIQDAAAGMQMFKGEIPTTPQGTPSAVGRITEQPYEFSLPDILTPKKVLLKTTQGLFESAPEIGAYAAGGVAGSLIPGGPIVKGASAIAAGSVLAATVNAAKTIAPTFAEELKSNPADPQAAYEMAIKKTKISAAGTGLSFAVFELAPFKNVVKDVLFQALGIQPAVGAGQKAAENIAEGKPVTEGTAGAALQAAAGTAVPLVGSKLLHALIRTEPTESLKKVVGGKLGKAPDDVTHSDIAQAIRMGFEDTAPKGADFKDTAKVSGIAEETLHKVYEEVGVTPTQAAIDARLSPKIAEDLAAGKVPEAYDAIRATEETAKPLPKVTEKKEIEPNQEPKIEKMFGKEVAEKEFTAAPSPQAPPAEETFYHGGLSGISKFKPFTHFGTEGAARERISAKEKENKDKTQELYPVKLEIKNPLRIEDDGGLEGPIEVSNAAMRAGGITEEQYTHIRDNSKNESMGKKLLKEALVKNGYDGLVYKNAIEDKGTDSYINLFPEQIKRIGAPPSPADLAKGGFKLEEAAEKQPAIAGGNDKPDVARAPKLDLSPEHLEWQEKLGIPEEKSPSQLGKIDAAIERIMAGNEPDIPKIEKMSDEQFNALEDYARRVEAAKTPVEENKLTKFLTDESGSVSFKLPEKAKEFVDDIKRDALMFATPMEVGSDRARSTAKDFANAMRWTRWNGTRIFNLLKEKYSPVELETMWNKLDESSDYAQNLEKEGMSREESIRKTEADKVGHFSLPEDQFEIVQAMNDWAKASWERAKKLEMVEGEGYPFWTPRMAAVIGEDGGWTTPKSEGGKPMVTSGRNLTTTAGSLRERKYETAEETEAAMKNLGEGTGVLVRDIRTMPLALTRLNQAIAGRALINKIKEVGRDTGADTVIGEHGGEGYFTIDHPAFQTYRPKLEMGENGKRKILNDEHGNPIFEKVPIYVSKEFEGPLKAVLSQDSGAAYRALMELKGKSMGLIMYSPMIHNAVEYGRALPLMPGKVATLKIYFEGNRVKKDPVLMQEAINNGLVPIGQRFFNQDITSILETPDLTPGRSWTAKLLGNLTDVVSKDAGQKVRSTIDNFGDLWHNTLLWDRVADLQMGLYTNMREQGIQSGLDPKSASTVAAHLANRYAGSLPMESMGNMSRKMANVALFSRSFTIGNLGVMKDMMTGLPSDVKAQLLRDIGAEGTEKAVTVARRKAIAAFAIDIALMYAGNSIVQDALDMMKRDKSIGQVGLDYVDRFDKLMKNHADSPWDLLNLPEDLHQLSSLATHEPGKEERVLFSKDPDTGTAYYMRIPTGKIGEEFLGWMTSPMEMIKKKTSPFVSPLVDIYKNEDYFGHPVYDAGAAGLQGAAENIGKAVWHIMKAQVPQDSIVSSYNMLTGGKSKDIDILKTVGPLAGITFSKGYPGGPEAGILAGAIRRHEDNVSAAMPQIKKAVENNKDDEARKIMEGLGMNPREQRSLINYYKNPAGKVNRRSINKFERIATPEEKALMEVQSKE